MSLTPAEMLTQRPGVRRAQGTVLIGGLGLGWLLKKVCEKDSVDRVIVVERSQELLDWYGHDLCRKFPKVSDVICDDVYNQIGKHGASTMHLLDIWLLLSDSSRDRRLLPFRRRLKSRFGHGGNEPPPRSIQSQSHRIRERKHTNPSNFSNRLRTWALPAMVTFSFLIRLWSRLNRNPFFPSLSVGGTSGL